MRCRAILLALLCAAAPADGGAPPQFSVWGAAARALPPAPAGWREARRPALPAASLEPTAAERTRGFILFARDPFAPVGPHAAPFPSERADALVVRAARGEYEPLTFSIHALRPLGRVTVSAAALRRGEAVIAADHVDVRIVRSVRTIADAAKKTWRWEPFLLERRAAFDVPQGQTVRVWLTVHVPANAAAGTYAGAVSIGGEAATMRLSVRVLPFTLPPAPVEMAMFLPRPPDDDALLRQQLVDLREHGCNGFDPAFAAEVVTRDRVFGDDDAAAIRAHATRMMKAAREVFGRWPERVRFSVGHQIAYYWDKPKNWFAFWPRDEKTESDFLKAVGVVRALAEREGWPPLLAFAQDEAGAHRLLDEARHYYALIKQRVPGLATCTTIGGGTAMGSDELGQLSDVIDFFATNRFTPELAKGLVERRKPYGVYNGASASPRFFFGFWGWKTGASQIAQWVYHFGSGALEGGLRQEDEGYTYMADDGPIPSPQWEAVREGIDDYRTIHLLRQRLAGAKGPAADRARRDLDAIVRSIPWGFQALRAEDRPP
ncbi:hypothetical protein HQ560_14795, partial [bacterium]|nr:hypothetical protein [bacterium]